MSQMMDCGMFLMLFCPHRTQPAQGLPSRAPVRSRGMGNSLGSAHVGWVTHVVEVDVALDPADVGLLRAIGVVLENEQISRLL